MVEPHTPPNDAGRKAVSTIVAGIIHADVVEKFRQVDKTMSKCIAEQAKEQTPSAFKPRLCRERGIGMT